MSTPNQNDNAARELADEEEDLLKLEQEIERIAQKVVECRTTLPDQLKSTLDSVLASQRPDLQTNLTVREIDGSVRVDGVAQGGGDISMMEDPKQAEKIQLLKQKISDNASALPVVLDRMKECKVRINKLKSSDYATIHPVFKRRRAI